MSFKNNNYIVVKNAISKELSNFLFDYFYLKRQVAYTMYTKNFMSPESEFMGTWKDEQAPNTYSIYADIAFETLLKKLKKKELLEMMIYLQLLN